MPRKKRTREESGLSALEDEYSTYTDDELRKTLIETGQNPGPIDASNRDMYIRLLVRKQKEQQSGSPSPEKPSLIPSSSLGPIIGSPSLTRNPLSATRKSTTKIAKLSVSPSLAAKPKKTSSVLNIEGLLAATFAPFTDEGDLNLKAIPSYADFLLKQGVSSIFVNGSTGESVSLTDDERKTIAEEWLRVAGKRMTIIVHVGSMSLKSTCELASHAERHGAAGISLIPPCYFKPPNLESLVLYIQKVGEAAPNTPLFYYHIPIMTGVKFSMEDFLKAASTSLPTLKGLKFTDEDLMEFTRCVAFQGGKYPIMYGRDEQVLASLAMGGKAAVGSTYNYCGALNNRLFKAFKEGDLVTALREQRRSDDGIVILKKYGQKFGNVAAGKAILKAKGFDAGPPRLPLLPLSADDHSSLVSDLMSIGFFEWS